MLKLMCLLRPLAGQIAIALLLIMGESIADLALPTLMAGIVDMGIASGVPASIYSRGWQMLLATALGTACAVGAAYVSSRIAHAFGRELRHRVFIKIAEFSSCELDRFGSATLLTRATNDVLQVQTFVALSTSVVARAPLMCIGGVFMAVRTGAALSLLLVAIVPVLVAAAVLIGIKSANAQRVIQDKLDRLSMILRESLTGVRVVRAFDRDEVALARFADANAGLTARALTAQRINAVMLPAMMLFANGTIVAVLWFGGGRIDAGQLQVGEMIAFLQYAILILLSFIMASVLFVSLPRATVSARRINEVLATDSRIRDPETARPAPGRSGLVEFSDVVFRYPGAEKPALDHVSFSARPGEWVAIIGGTAAGKSTLVNLIPRLYDVDAGSVCVDGVDVRAMQRDDLRGRIGFVPQEARLFSGTVAENVRFGDGKATDECVRRAVAVAQAEDLVASSPDGLAAAVTQGGANLSGGQRQRLAIARALARKPSILVLDDSFSALDFKTESALHLALLAERKNMTVLMVAQRVSTVMRADRILVLDKGCLVGSGTHRDLLGDCRVYREIVASQLEGAA